MWLNALQLHQLAREAKNSASDQRGLQRSCYDVCGWGVIVEAELECCVLCFFCQIKKKIFETLGLVEFGTIYTYEHSHMPKINSSPVKILHKVLAEFPQLGLQIFLNS